MNQSYMVVGAEAEEENPARRVVRPDMESAQRLKSSLASDNRTWQWSMRVSHCPSRWTHNIAYF